MVLHDFYLDGVKQRGRIDEESKIYSKYVAYKNRKRKPEDAWSIDKPLFMRILLPNNYKIIITDVENNKVYELFANELMQGDTYREGSPEQFGPQIYKFIRAWREIETDY